MTNGSNENTASPAGTQDRLIALVMQTTQHECEVLRTPLKQAGLAVKTTTSAEEAEDFYLRHRPAVIIVPAYLPSGSSYVFCRRIRDRMDDRETPIILTTGIVSGRLMIEARTKWGVNDVIVMPATVQKLLSTVGQQIGRDLVAASEQSPRSRISTFTDFRVTAGNLPKKTISPEGDLAEVRPERVLRLMSLNRRSGQVMFQKDEAGITLSFVEGRLGQINSTWIPEKTLADFLVQSQRFGAEALREARELASRSRRLLGEVLLEMGLLRTQELNAVLQAHMFEKGVLIFGWTEGRYEFRRRETDITEETAIRLSVANLIFKGMRRFGRVDDLEQVRALTSMPLKLRQDKGFTLEDLDLTYDEKRAVVSLNGRNTFDEVREYSGLTREDLLSLLAALAAVHMVGAQRPA